MDSYDEYLKRAISESLDDVKPETNSKNKVVSAEVKILDEYKSEHEIMNMLLLPCAHRSRYDNGRLMGNKCESVCATLLKCLNGNQILSNNLILKFLEFVTPRKEHLYYDIHSRMYCLWHGTESIIQVIQAVVKSHALDHKCISVILKYPCFDTCLQTLTTENKNFTKFSSQEVGIIVESRLEHICSSDETTQLLCDIVLNNIILDTDNLIELSKSRVVYMSDRLSQHVDKCSENIDELVMINACKSLPYTKSLVKSLINRQLVITDQIFGRVCEYCDVESLKFILEQSKIIPTREHYHKLVASKVYNSDKDLENKNRYRGPYNHNKDGDRDRYSKGGYSMEKMDVLISHGFKPDYDDITYGIKFHVEIPNIKRFSIKPDLTFLNVCYDHDFYPKYGFECISDEMIELQKLCAVRNKPLITKYMKKYKLVPDRKCMENASRIKGNLPVVRMLIDNGGKVTYQCIEKHTKEMFPNSMLSYLVKNFDINKTSKIVELEDKVKQLEAQLKNKDITKEDKQDKENKQEDKENKQEDKENKQEDKENKQEDKEASPKVDKMITITDDQLTKQPKQIRRDCLLPTKYATYFKSNNNEKKSFIQIKKDFIISVKANKWYKKDNQLLIDPPKDMRKLLGLDETGYIKFNDLEKMLYLFYN
jgi:hypothetical protein